ncbi:hypothetical protein SAMN02745168_0222 [Papillibacter cinnamivorans DSM 12816]|uniref:Uncharacterized protein n=1 Tax=Papillibacter cinnamivorans DSM 12816 TaxID=1122930 RepID=A0A1W2CU74_9FIRM|nr:hypothetical protein SAMN02745168_0222 [Papillibacter cinnamivorans DSM 12816]
MCFKTIYFKTKLDKARIEAVLSGCTLKWNLAGFTTGNVFLSKFRGNRFYLTKTFISGAFSRGSIPFVGRILEREAGSVILGRFRLPIPSYLIAAGFAAFAWISSVSSAFRLHSAANLPIILTALFFWTLGLCFLFIFVPNWVCGKEKEEVLKFIRTRLEAEPAEKEETLDGR